MEQSDWRMRNEEGLPSLTSFGVADQDRSQ